MSHCRLQQASSQQHSKEKYDLTMQALACINKASYTSQGKLISNGLHRAYCLDADHIAPAQIYADSRPIRGAPDKTQHTAGRGPLICRGAAPGAIYAAARGRSAFRICMRHRVYLAIPWDAINCMRPIGGSLLICDLISDRRWRGFFRDFKTAAQLDLGRPT